MFSCRYASGTLPWGNPNTPGFEPQRHDDGYLEVIGFTYSSLVRLLTIEEMLLTLMLIAESCTLYTREINVEIFIHSELSYYKDCMNTYQELEAIVFPYYSLMSILIINIVLLIFKLIHVAERYTFYTVPEKLSRKFL